jgi:hypothetical protein
MAFPAIRKGVGVHPAENSRIPQCGGRERAMGSQFDNFLRGSSAEKFHECAWSTPREKDVEIQASAHFQYSEPKITNHRRDYLGNCRPSELASALDAMSD